MSIEPLRFDPPNFDYADRLGPATPEQRAEVKSSLGMRIFNAVLVSVALVMAAVVLMGAGIYIGATKPDVWNHVPGVPSLSGERAEPEESAK